MCLGKNEEGEVNGWIWQFGNVRFLWIAVIAREKEKERWD